MQQPANRSGGVGQVGVRRRERLRPARGYVMRVKLSVEERDQIRAGAAQAGMAPAGFVARAALDAAVTAVVPVGARSTVEQLAGLQVELVAVRRKLDLLRAALTASADDQATGPAGEVLRGCGQAAGQLADLSRQIHRRLEGGA